MVDDSVLRVRFEDGTEATSPVQRFPRLLHATPKERSVWRIIGKGDGIHWPEIDEDISIRSLRGEMPLATASSEKIEEVLKLTGEIYKASHRLREISGGRSFTPDGHFVAAVGKVVAEYIYDLRPVSDDVRFVDAVSSSGASVQIMLAGPTGTKFGIRWSKGSSSSHADILLCLKLTAEGFQEIYNGSFPVELVEGKPAGQVQISVKRLIEHNPALLEKAHSFASINGFLPAQLANVA
ncbi:DUF2442 domain-containing protein [Granulicella tundricola]|uniref:DUF6998 domain-containing protein n=1 Tax=Granulicella tundricola (strain ATCC BAA-1859 / DSM 23138 / MP5ACTX9) TaxID=1198114 RepID=E8WZU0_GRATM|nr:DUF2442 domain-containing protein [Granulicella tundricola]ADW67751.1 hypothetical protein AciX9_0681 [Granulicella tundricola MP5ACTX9]